ncbi:hypothetical protein L345_00255, partial [Ophiophagus hannah]
MRFAPNKEPHRFPPSPSQNKLLQGEAAPLGAKRLRSGSPPPRPPARFCHGAPAPLRLPSSSCGPLVTPVTCVSRPAELAGFIALVPPPLRFGPVAASSSQLRVGR